MVSFAQIDKKNNGEYLKLLDAISKLSGLFSESGTPFINYRVAENVFCKSFDAENLSRSDTAYDAKYQNEIGVGLKTFICEKEFSNEKIAEFNALSKNLSSLQGKELAQELARYRNERIELANRLYNITTGIYHIVARRNSELVLFETDYNKIDIANIKNIKTTKAGIAFNDGLNQYSFNSSKSTLFRKFYIPKDAFTLPIEIIEDPYTLLLDLFRSQSFKEAENKLVKGGNFVILPLYGIKNGEKFVFEKSGLNQWNAAGRKRDFGEIYIPIPIEVHKLFPNFFPQKDQVFDLKVPTGEIFTAKVCQENSKALMTNPNKALSDWLLRKLLQLQEGEKATIEKLLELGFDSVIIYKDGDGRFSIDKAQLDSYEDFINED
ncbi:restriction endonuclease [Acinetobacter johnsonii]|uniref:Restriction endonuclease n=1 Tax=Acinetobacter johnsonii TaxID=40214 RepID=A0A3Q8XFR1_ACIJO|nr:restriction endonuclease [Acinetobacter johnsonii]AZN65588.1 restriction endonuclease [Acinetobacter johnsonii]